MRDRQYEIQEGYFKQEIEPYIEMHNKRPGRPEKINHYQFFCAALYILRTGIPWRDLPACYGNWHTIYTRFKRWSENGLFWHLVYQLQQQKKIKIDFTWIDSTTVSVHRHGSGSLKKRDHSRLAEAAKD